MNDADIEMTELGQISVGLTNAKRNGVCAHQTKRGLTCTDGCGRVFASEEEWVNAIEEVYGEWT